MHFPSALAVPVSILLWCVAAPSQDASPIPVEYKDGRFSRVEVLELLESKVRLRVHVLGGSMVVKHALAEFTPDSAFRIEVAATKPSTYEAHFQLAKKAAQLKLISLAGNQAREAVKCAGEDKAKINAVRAWGAGALEAAFEEAIRAKAHRDAEHYLKLLSTRLADQRSEEQLETLSASLDALKQMRADEREAARRAKLDAQARAAIERQLEPVYARIKSGDKLQREALKKSRNTSQSSNLDERAIAAYRLAWKATQALSKKYPSDDALQEELANIGRRLHENAIRAALHAANMLTIQSDYKGAMGWAMKVLEFDPENAEAKQMVQTIQIASAAASDRWGWGWAPTMPRNVRRH